MGNSSSTSNNQEKVISVKSSYTDEEINANIARLLAETSKNIPQAVENADTETLALPDTVASPTVRDNTIAQAGGSKRYRQYVDSMMETTENNQAGGGIVASGSIATPMSASSPATPAADTDLRELSEFSEFRRIKEYVINNAMNSTETATMVGGAKKAKKAKKSKKTKTAKATKSAKVVSPFSESSIPSTSPESALSSHSGGFSPTSTNVFTSSDMENLNKTSTYNSNNSDSEYNIHPFYSESSDVSSRFPHSKDRF